MYTRWTQHLKTDEEKENFRNRIYAAKDVLDRLTQIIEEDEAALERSEMDQRVYSNPSWDYLQAHRNGNKQVYYQMKKYTNLDQEDKNA